LYSQGPECCLFHKYKAVQEREQKEGDEGNRKNNIKGEK
jgi:hypothetical protein